MDVALLVLVIDGGVAARYRDVLEHLLEHAPGDLARLRRRPEHDPLFIDHGAAVG